MNSIIEMRKKLAEIDKEKNELAAKLAEAEEKELERQRNENFDTIINMPEEEKLRLLNLIEHEYESCSRGNCENGWSEYRNRFFCKRCMLEEILGGEHCGRFRFKMSVEIEEIKI